MQRPLLALATLVVLPTVAHASEPMAEGVFVGWTNVQTRSFFRATPMRTAVELGWARTIDEARTGLPLELAAGLRGALPDDAGGVPGELFVRARLVARLGYWEPALGPELGWSGLARLGSPPGGLPDDIDRVEGARLGGLYLGFDAAPLRFRFGRVTASVFELLLGAGLWPAGGVLRVEFSWLQLGVAL
jgi:hypothetical protein